MDDYDNIIIGAGHNGLICATYLAQKGHSVLLLESSSHVGGLAATREFHPGYKVSVAHSLSHFSETVASELNLSAHGFNPSGETLETIGLNLQGTPVVLSGDQISGVSTDDAEKYSEYLAVLKRFAKVLKPFWLKTMPRIGHNTVSDLMTFGHLGLNLRMLGKKDMGEFMRVATLPARDLMDENFDNDLLKAVLSWDGLVGSKMAPRSPNATVLNMLYRMSGKDHGAHSLPEGGIESLINALKMAAVSAGVEIQTNAAVSRIIVDGDENGLKATGVELADGRKISAIRVISSADPKRTFLNLVGAKNLEIEFTNRINRLRCDGYVAKLHLALSDLPMFTGVEKPCGRMIIAPEMDAIEFAFDHAKYGEYSDSPVMEILLPSVKDSTLAPKGCHVLSAHVMYIPHSLKTGWTDHAKEALYQTLVQTLERYAPGITKHIVHGELMTPADLEQTFNVTGGHWHHTELAMDQMLMMRPTYEAGQYSSPVKGLYLCGAGSHPGGGLMGGPGHNAAKEILRAEKKR
ncbi:MAG: NAD(P)/FAD-dependent oxidoreductase [Porticoccaceae bacterium]|nr:NAD(P)/FAD-dependent oxidoreductase [Porticoccaceae bacterium]